MYLPNKSGLALYNAVSRVNRALDLKPATKENMKEFFTAHLALKQLCARHKIEIDLNEDGDYIIVDTKIEAQAS